MHKILIPAGFVRDIVGSTLMIGLAEALRHLWIEPTRVAFQCVNSGAFWWCSPRAALILLAGSGVLGYVSVAAGAWAVVRCSAAAARVALMAGAIGLVFYNYDFSAVGLLCGLLVLWRGTGQQRNGGKQDT